MNRAGVWYAVMVERDDGFRTFYRPFLLQKTAQEMIDGLDPAEWEGHSLSIVPVVAIDDYGDPYYEKP